jgi:hypothetical protein
MDDQTTRAGDPLAADFTSNSDNGTVGATDEMDMPVQEATLPVVDETTADTSPEAVPADEAVTPEVTPDAEATTPEVMPEVAAPAEEVTPDAEATTPEMMPDVAAPAPEVTPDAEATTPEVMPDAGAPAEAVTPARPSGNGGGGRGGRGGGGRGGYGGSGSDMAALLAESEQQFRQLKYGDVLEGRIMRKDPDEILVDIGSKSEGVIPMSEVSSLTPAELQALDVGVEVLVSVVQPENQEGHVVLSLDKARQERSWRNLQK